MGTLPRPCLNGSGHRLRIACLRRPAGRAGRDHPRRRSRARRCLAGPAAGRLAPLGFAAGAGRRRDAEWSGAGSGLHWPVARAPGAGRSAISAGTGPRRTLARQRSRADRLAPSAPPCRLARRRSVQPRPVARVWAPLGARRTRRLLADRRACRARHPVADRPGRRRELGPPRHRPGLGQPARRAGRNHAVCRVHSPAAKHARDDARHRRRSGRGTAGPGRGMAPGMPRLHRPRSGIVRHNRPARRPNRLARRPTRPAGNRLRHAGLWSARCAGAGTHHCLGRS